MKKKTAIIILISILAVIFITVTVIAIVKHHNKNKNKKTTKTPMPVGFKGSLGAKPSNVPKFLTYQKSTKDRNLQQKGSPFYVRKISDFPSQYSQIYNTLSPVLLGITKYTSDLPFSISVYDTPIDSIPVDGEYVRAFYKDIIPIDTSSNYLLGLYIYDPKVSVSL